MLQPGDKLYTKNNNKINMLEFQGDMIESKEALMVITVSPLCF